MPANDRTHRPEDVFTFGMEKATLHDIAVGPGAWTVAPLQSIASKLAAACSAAIIQQRCVDVGVKPIPLDKEYIALAVEALDYLQMAAKGQSVSTRLREPEQARSVTLDDATTREIDAFAEISSLEHSGTGINRDTLVAALKSLTNGHKDVDALAYGRETFSRLASQFRSLLSASRPELGE
jgi:hypothetical protein